MRTGSKTLSSAQAILYACTASLLFMLLSQLPSADAIGCFVCSSINGSEPECEDTFNNTNRFYQQNCKAGRKGRSGLFPGTECVKMKAELVENSFSILVRTCVVDNGDINSGTEIGRIDHCGLVDQIIYNDNNMRGCILTCDTDGCNGGTTTTVSSAIFVSGLIISLLVGTESRYMMCSAGGKGGGC